MKLHPSFFQVEVIRTLSGYSVWSFTNMISDQVRLRTAAFVIGAFCSASLVTHYSIAESLSRHCLTLIERATSFLVPLFTRYHALKDFEAIREKFILFTRINVILAAFGGGLLILLSKAFITRWMGPDYLDALPVLIVLMAGTIIEAIQKPTANVLFAIAKHRFYALASLAEAAANILLCIYLVQHYGMMGVAVGIAVPLVVNRFFVIPVYTSYVIGLEARIFYASMVRTCMLTALYLGLWYLLARAVLEPPTYYGIALAGLAAIPLYLLLVYVLVLKGSERAFLHSLLPGPLRRRMKNMLPG
jgi:O-antigen/teichoic acid export membrane protein